MIQMELYGRLQTFDTVNAIETQKTTLVNEWRKKTLVRQTGNLRPTMIVFSLMEI